MNDPVKMHTSERIRTFLVSYATGRFVRDQEDLMASGLRFGVTDPRPWNIEMLRATPFYSQHRTTLEMERGAGYWLWKPFIIQETLGEMQEGECLIYADAGIEVIADLTPLLRTAVQNSGMMLFRGTGQCWEFTKRDCFFYLNADEPRFHEALMVDASLIISVKSAQVCEFVSEWLANCLDRRVLTDEPNICGLPDLPGFRDHRHDQSILSLLAERKGLELLDYPAQYVNHHRGRHVRVNRFIDEHGRSLMSLEIPRAVLLEKMRRRSG